MEKVKQYTGVDIKNRKIVDVTNCRLELYSHIFLKGMQTGSVVGMVYAPAYSSLHLALPDQFRHERRPLTHCVTTGLVLGGLLAPLIYYLRYRPLTEADCCLRARKLRHSATTQWMDRMSAAGALVGAGAAYFLWGERFMGGAVLGFAGGSIIGCVIGAGILA